MPLKPIAVLAWLMLYGLLALLPMGLALGIERPPPRGLLVEIGAMLGLLGLGMLATQLVASGRQRWVAAGVGQDNLLQFHRRTGLVAWILVLSHPLLLMVGDPGFVAWIDPRVDLLRAGTLAGLVVALSTLIINSLWREPLGLQYETWHPRHECFSGKNTLMKVNLALGTIPFLLFIGLVVAMPLVALAYSFC